MIKGLRYAISIQILSLAFWLWIWSFPITLVNLSMEESGLGFDPFRFFDAANCLIIQSCYRDEIITTPMPVYWAYVILKFGNVNTLAFIQALIYGLLCARLINKSNEMGVPSHLITASVLCPTILTYICMPSKEFFIISSAIASITYFVNVKNKSKFSYDVVFMFFGVLALIARPAFMLVLLSLYIGMFLPFRKSFKWSILISVILAVMPKDFEHFQRLNDVVPSHSTLMQYFREMSASDEPFLQLVFTPVRFIFYILFPFPLLTIDGMGMPSSDSDMDLYFGMRLLSIESLNFLWFGIYTCSHFFRKSLITSNKSRSYIKSMALFYVYSILFIAAASPLPSARYRVVSLLGLPAVSFVLISALKQKINIKKYGSM